MKLVTQSYQKKWLFQEIPAPKKGSSSEKVAAQNEQRFKNVDTLNYYYSGDKSPPKQ